jgi:hypothetical protein
VKFQKADETQVIVPMIRTESSSPSHKDLLLVFSWMSYKLALLFDFTED